jgi:hypothetical protein
MLRGTYIIYHYQTTALTYSMIDTGALYGHNEVTPVKSSKRQNANLSGIKTDSDTYSIDWDFTFSSPTYMKKEPLNSPKPDSDSPFANLYMPPSPSPNTKTVPPLEYPRRGSKVAIPSRQTSLNHVHREQLEITHYSSLASEDKDPILLLVAMSTDSHKRPQKVGHVRSISEPILVSTTSVVKTTPIHVTAAEVSRSKKEKWATVKDNLKRHFS